MEKGRIVLRAVVGLVGTSNAIVAAMQTGDELKYRRARREFEAVYAESERLLGVADNTLAHASELGPA